MSVSLRNIAEALGLSKATVSWILSGQGQKKGFSQATIKRVKEYAESVNYEPNLLARSLSIGETRTIGLIIPFINDTFYAQIVQNIEVAVSANDYTLMVCTSEGDSKKEYELVKMLKSKQVDGVIIAPTKNSVLSVDFMLKSKLPFVLIDRYLKGIEANYVIVNNKESCYNVVSNLISNGCKKIALLTTDIDLYVMRERSEGYQKAIKENALCEDPSLQVFIDRTNYKEDIKKKLDLLLEKVPDVDGFFFSTHYLALEALRYFFMKRIPFNETFLMGCFHYTSALDILAPKMLISRMHVEKMGQEAVRILLENIKDKTLLSQGVVVPNILNI